MTEDVLEEAVSERTYEDADSVSSELTLSGALPERFAESEYRKC